MIKRKKYLIKGMLKGELGIRYVSTFTNARFKFTAKAKAIKLFKNKYKDELNAGYKLIINKSPQQYKGGII